MTRLRLIALGLAWSGVAVADPRAVALSDALAGVSASPAHQVSEAQRREAAAAVDAAGAWPTSSFAVSTTREVEKLDVIATLPLPVFGTLGANRAVAREALAVAIADVRASDLHVAQDIATAWFALARAEAHAEASQRNATRQAELVHAASERFAAGDASHADVVLATAAAKRLAARAAADAGEIDVASADLAAALGWDPTQRLHAAGGLPEIPASAPGAAVHPELAAATQRVAAERARVTEVARVRWPRLGLELESALGDPTLPGPDYRVGVVAEVPLFGHGDRLVRAAEARVATARLESAQIGTRLAGALARARAHFATTARLATSLATDVLPAQREAADLSRVAYREGQTGIAVMLEAERALADAEIEAIDARADAGVAFVERVGVGDDAVTRVLVLAIVVLAACRKQTAAPDEADEPAGPVEVTCAAARAEPSVARIEVRGVVGVPPDRSATVASAVAGRIADVRVHEGEHVAKGALLATVDDPSLAPAVAEGDAAVTAAQAGVANAETVLARANRLVSQGVAPRRDAEDAEARRATAAADLATARAKAGLAHRQLDRAHVVAPIAGVVVKLMKHVGELVDGTPATPLVEIADPSTLELHADVPAADLVRMRVDQKAEVVLDALPDQKLGATIAAVSPAVTTATALGAVRATLAPAPDGVQLVLGLAGVLRIEVPRPAGGVSVPATALRRAADGTSQVVGCKGGVAHPIAVVPGARTGDRVEIASGLAAGEEVVVDHVLRLEEGGALKVAK